MVCLLWLHLLWLHLLWHTSSSLSSHELLRRVSICCPIFIAPALILGPLQGGRLSTPPPGPILLPPCPLTSIVNLVYYLLATLD